MFFIMWWGGGLAWLEENRDVNWGGLPGGADPEISPLQHGGIQRVDEAILDFETSQRNADQYKIFPFALFTALRLLLGLSPVSGEVPRVDDDQRQLQSPPRQKQTLARRVSALAHRGIERRVFSSFFLLLTRDLPRGLGMDPSQRKPPIYSSHFTNCNTIWHVQRRRCRRSARRRWKKRGCEGKTKTRRGKRKNQQSLAKSKLIEMAP